MHRAHRELTVRAARQHRAVSKVNFCDDAPSTNGCLERPHPSSCWLDKAR